MLLRHDATVKKSKAKSHLVQKFEEASDGFSRKYLGESRKEKRDFLLLESSSLLLCLERLERREEQEGGQRGQDEDDDHEDDRVPAEVSARLGHVEHPEHLGVLTTPGELERRTGQGPLLAEHL